MLVSRVISRRLAPIFSAIPTFASAPVLVLLGVDLLALTKFLNLDDTVQALPSFCTIALMPYLYSIDGAIMFGLAMHYVLQAMLFARGALWPAASGAPADAAESDKRVETPAPLSRQKSINAADAFATYHERSQESAMLSARATLLRAQSLPVA